jgi:hypothetical protein
MGNFTHEQHPHRDIQRQWQDAVAGPFSLAQTNEAQFREPWMDLTFESHFSTRYTLKPD